MAAQSNGWTPISIEYEGRVICGVYLSSSSAVTVRTTGGSKKAPLSGLSPTYLAKILLRQLEREGRA